LILALGRDLPAKRLLVVAISASSLTHPVAWYIASILSPDEYSVGVWLIETGVVLSEAGWYQFWLRVGAGKSLLWSLMANASSFGFGWLLLRS
jgi:hypothetical protein